jgi:hypothetical protein
MQWSPAVGEGFYRSEEDGRGVRHRWIWWKRRAGRSSPKTGENGDLSVGIWRGGASPTVRCGRETVGSYRGSIWMLGRAGAAARRVGARACFGGFLEPRRSGENGGGAVMLMARRDVERRGAGERWVGLEASCSERRQRRVTENVIGHTTGEEQEAMEKSTRGSAWSWLLGWLWAWPEMNRVVF